MRTCLSAPDRRGFLIFATLGLAWLGAVGAPMPVLAQGAGDLIVAPTRVVFEGRNRSAQLSLVNKGSATSTYRISVINMRMSDSGELQAVDKPKGDEKFADKLFRYSPRQVTLNPGASQAIRLLLRKPKDLADGEYRSHILFRGIPKEGGQSVEAPKDPNAIEIRLIPIFGLTIPVIVRHGELSTKVAVDNMIMPVDDKNKLPRASFRLNREGMRSTFGDVTISIANGGNDVVIGQIMRLAVYTPNTHRDIVIPLRVPDGVNLSGEMKVTYKTIADEGAKLLGEGSVKLP